MRAREDAGLGSRLYFAYSTVLDREAFEEWRGQHGYDFFSLPDGRVAEARGQELVFDFPSRWWGGRVAGLAPEEGKSVWGLVFEIAERDWPVIQHKEGLVTGMSVEREVQVEVQGTQILASAFVTNPARASQVGPLSPRFLEALVRGATVAALPVAWLAELRSLS